jgi:hypothetical protein
VSRAASPESDDDRPLTEIEREKILSFADEHSVLWNETLSSLQKWLFATLITLHLGGLAYVANSNIHPWAIENASLCFFAGLAFSLLAALSEIIKINRIKDLAFRVKYEFHSEKEKPKSFDFKRNFDGWNRSYITLLFAVISVGFFYFAGSNVIEGMRPCTKDDLEKSIISNSNVVTMGRFSKNCYFYKIKGLPDDPLKRAILEKKLLETRNAR